MPDAMSSVAMTPRLRRASMPDALAAGRPQSAMHARSDSLTSGGGGGGGESAVAAAMSTALGEASERRSRARANVGMLPDLSAIEHQAGAAAAATRAWDQARAPREKGRLKNEDQRDAEKRAAARIKRSDAAKREVSSLRQTLRQTQPAEGAEQMLTSVLRAKESERRKEQSAAARLKAAAAAAEAAARLAALAARPAASDAASAASSSSNAAAAAAAVVAAAAPGGGGGGGGGGGSGGSDGGGGGTPRVSRDRVQWRGVEEDEPGGAEPLAQAAAEGGATTGGEGVAASAADGGVTAAAADAAADEVARGGDTAPAIAQPEAETGVQEEMAEWGPRRGGDEPPAHAATWDWIRSPPKHRPTPRPPQTRRVKVHGVWIEVDEEED